MIKTKGDFPGIMTKTNGSLEKQRDTRRSRTEIERKIKDGNYIEWMKERFGVMEMDEIIADKEFINDMIKEIERVREEKIVYDKDYKKYDLDKWRRKNNRKLLLRRINEKAREKREKWVMGEGVEDVIYDSN